MHKPKGYWTKERCANEALKYKTKKDFKYSSKSAYFYATKNLWLEEICSHMIEIKKPNNYWTKERCAIEALKYETKKDFKINAKNIYQAAQKNKWLDDICGHMKVIGSKYKRCIYVYEFSDNSAYIGLTYNIKIRQIDRNNNQNDSVTKHITESELHPEFKQLTEYIDVEEAIKLEGYYVEKYKSEGWNILNKAKTGSIGGNIIKWTEEKCQEEALKYNNKSDFYNKNKAAYSAAYKHKWLKEICQHMIQKKKSNGYWTKEKCHEEALKYNTRTFFHKNSASAYNCAYLNNWINEICSHMKKQIKKCFWTREKCIEETYKYKYLSDFIKYSSGAYSASLKNGWINEICNYLEYKQKPNNYWTKEKCQKEALKYTTKYEFKQKSSGAYTASYKNGWLDEFYPIQK
jgi:hypothetical protein